MECRYIGQPYRGTILPSVGILSSFLEAKTRWVTVSFRLCQAHWTAASFKREILIFFGGGLESHLLGSELCVAYTICSRTGGTSLSAAPRYFQHLQQFTLLCEHLVNQRTKELRVRRVLWAWITREDCLQKGTLETDLEEWVGFAGKGQVDTLKTG